jgi:hypothetical protein
MGGLCILLLPEPNGSGDVKFVKADDAGTGPVNSVITARTDMIKNEHDRKAMLKVARFAAFLCKYKNEALLCDGKN